MDVVNPDTRRLIGLAAVAVIVEYAITAVHHVYGGIVFGTPERLYIAVVFTAILLLTLGLLWLYRRTGGAWALYGFAALIAVFWVVLLGVGEGGYNHTYASLLYLGGMPVENYPEDVFFQLTGILTFVSAYFPALYTVRLIREQWSGRGSGRLLPSR